MDGSIVILDFGGQYSHLIARRVREFGAYSEIRLPETPAEELRGAAGIILSGGPQSVYEEGSPHADPAILELGIPVLGLCYGHQWLGQTLGGVVRAAHTKEYGDTPLRVEHAGTLLVDLPPSCTVWMSHGDEVSQLPPGFVRTAATADCANAAMEHAERRIFGIQFHIEVTHTQHGMDILRRFIALCAPRPWSVTGYRDRLAAQVREEVGDRHVFMLVSGGVDSTVAFTLLNEVLGPDRVQGLLVDTGLMRKNEIPLIQSAFDALGIRNLRVEDASAEFFAALDGVTDPERKRRIIGDAFLSVQRRVSDAMGLSSDRGWMLGQGTIYPDTIESGGTKHAAHIKTHHNRVEAIAALIEQGLVIEPLRELYKDEVRMVGEELGLPHDLVWRHPFPGPGLGVRILCADAPAAPPAYPTDASRAATDDLIRTHGARILPVRTVGVQGDGRTYRHALAFFGRTDRSWAEQQATSIPNALGVFSRVLLCLSHHDPQEFTFTPGGITRERADLLREADAIVDEEVRRAGLYGDIWQFPVVLLPIGVRPGGQSIVLRPVVSIDAMTVQAARLPDALLQVITARLLALGIDLVFADLTHKPPATIEWE